MAGGGQKSGRTGFALALAALLAVTPAALGAPGDLGREVDRRCRPCQDFDRHVNGRWKQTHPTPADVESWDRFEQITEENTRRLRSLLERSAARPFDEHSRKLGNYYASCMDTARIEAEGLAPLQMNLEAIAAVRDRESLAAVVAGLHRRGVDGLFALHTREAGLRVPVLAEVGPPSLAMAEPFYYSRAAGSRWRRQFLAHAERLFGLSGRPLREARAAARTVVAVETALASGIGEGVRESRTAMTVEQLVALAPRFAWRAYFDGLGQGGFERLGVQSAAYFRRLDRLLGTVSLDDLRTYLSWRLLDAAAPYLGRQFLGADARFKGQFWDVADERLPRWQRCVQATGEALGDLLGEAYVQEYIAPGTRDRVVGLVEALRRQLRRVFEEGSYAPETRRAALAKLDTLGLKVAYPERWRDYADVAIDRGAFLGNVLQAWRYATAEELARVGRPPDRSAWQAAPEEVNAYYDLDTNEIVLPAGILQPPFFDPEADDALNFGALGSIIGHELTHGLSALEQYDAEGVHRRWWAAVDEEEFRRRVGCLTRQLKRSGVPGRGALAESVADLGGLQLSWQAFLHSPAGSSETIVDGYTPAQRFFLGFARIWAANEPYGVDTQYAPSRLRVNLSLANLAEFARTFDCKKGERMVVPPAQRCRIW